MGLPTRQKKMAVGTHTEVVKPRSKDSPVYCWVRDKMNNCLARFEHDVFLAMAMAGLDSDERYQNYRGQAWQIVNWLNAYCGFRSVFCAGCNLETKEKFEAEDFSLSEDLAALRRSKYLMLVYPERITSSVLFEAGLAVALGKPSVYFIRDPGSLPFLMKKAEQASLPAGVRIYEYESPARIEAVLRNPGEGLWKYLGHKP